MLIKNEFYPRTITKDSVREAFGVLKKYKAARYFSIVYCSDLSCTSNKG